MKHRPSVKEAKMRQVVIFELKDEMAGLRGLISCLINTLLTLRSHEGQ
jgi:hypothetical protein